MANDRNLRWPQLKVRDFMAPNAVTIHSPVSLAPTVGVRPPVGPCLFVPRIEPRIALRIWRGTFALSPWDVGQNRVSFPAVS